MTDQTNATPADPSGPVRLGIVGLGTQGGAYARFLREGRVPSMTLGAVCDIEPDRKAAADEAGVPFFADFRGLLASGCVDAIVTTVPHYLHPEVGIAAVDAGVACLVEKPVGVYTSQARALLERAAARPEVVVGVMFNQRTNPLYVDLKALIDSGELGRLRHMSWTITTWWRPQGYYDLSAWRATWGGEGGGVLVNQAPHQLDLLQWLCGVPRRVFASCAFGFRRDIAVEDEVHALLDFGDGVTGYFLTCTHDLAGTDRLELLLDGGKIVVTDSRDVAITRLARPEQELSAGLTREDVGRLMSGQLDLSDQVHTEHRSYESIWGEQHCLVLENFARAVLAGEPLLAPGADGIHGVRLANAMHLSAWTGRQVELADFDEAGYLTELNARIAAEGLFPAREQGR